ncbi:SGNH/GDSL hydrolase family protein [Motilibacter deserti]|uniref:GDSL-like lipase/acylhydrolase family protein n=1 Tax=Motilibacter deserti TaxID=2714956 RepID=A0ABX0H2H7_9ACTN|nr:GDSL-type esterase/lipase family protein [Motilibacter deserti]NHC15932.1 hypothetical protein [Motilibacter deserti]
MTVKPATTSLSFVRRLRPGLTLGLVAATFASALVTTGVALPDAAEAAKCRPEQCGEYEPPPPAPPKPVRPGGVTPLIVQMGDSYASGEGAPDANGQYLGSQDCHRSNRAGFTVAGNRLKANNPYQGTIDVRSFACSGAVIVGGTQPDRSERDGGILSPQKGRLPQIDQVNASVGTRRIDTLVISGGGNDMSFSDIALDCTNVMPWNADCSRPGSEANRLLAMNAPLLDDKYDMLIEAVQGRPDGTGRRLDAPVGRVLLTAYPDVMTSDSGAGCHNTPWGDPLSGFQSVESNWARANVLNFINDQMYAAAARANARPGVHPYWEVVPAPDFVRHGFCASSSTRWVNTAADSFGLQWDEKGALHPNAAGQAQWGSRIYDHLKYINY